MQKSKLILFVFTATLLLQMFSSGNSFDSRQNIPLVKKIKIKDKILFAEIAERDPVQTKGLMFRESLPWNAGMLFIYPYEKVLYFWMKNTLIPLDIGFFDKNQILKVIKNMKPHDETSISSEVPVRFALEVNLDWFKKNNINIGDKFEYID